MSVFRRPWALGDLKHKWRDAIKALTRLFEDDMPDWVRRTCVDALAQIGKPQTKEAFLIALCDVDAEIRVRAATGLKLALGAAEAIACIVDCMITERSAAARLSGCAATDQSKGGIASHFRACPAP